MLRLSNKLNLCTVLNTSEYFVLEFKYFSAVIVLLCSKKYTYTLYWLDNMYISSNVQNIKAITKLFKHNLSFPSCNITYIGKIKFKRKGSWINIKRTWPSISTLKFGHGKPTLVLANNVISLKYKKHLLHHTNIVSSYSQVILRKYLNLVQKTRQMGMYTLRGIKIARTGIHRRKGKVSRYKHLKSKIF